MNSKIEKDCWDKFHIIGQLLIPLLIFGFGIIINNTLKKTDANFKKFEIALSILNSPVDTNHVSNNELREWATKAFHEYTGIKSDIPTPIGNGKGKILSTDTIYKGQWFIDSISGMSMFIKEISLLGKNQIQAEGIIRRPHDSESEKNWGPWKLPNQWSYKSDGKVYSIVVAEINGNNEKCVVSVYELY